MFVDMKTLIEKTGASEVSVRRMMTREDLVRGEHFTSDHGVFTRFDQVRCTQRLIELGAIKAPEVLA